MSQFVDHGEGLRTLGVVRVYSDERRDIICQGKSAKHIDRYFSMVAAEVIHKEDEYPDRFNLGSQISDGITDRPAPSVGTKIESDCFSDPPRQNAGLLGCACSSDERQRLRFTLFFKCRAHQ